MRQCKEERQCANVVIVCFYAIFLLFCNDVALKQDEDLRDNSARVDECYVICMENCDNLWLSTEPRPTLEENFPDSDQKWAIKEEQLDKLVSRDLKAD